MNKIIKTALTQYGIAEVRGLQHNPEILKYFRQSGFEYINDDETPWCSAFVNWVAFMTDHERTEKLNARSWLDIGKVIQEEEPLIGDVVIFWRGADPNGWQGHVAFYIGENETHYFVLGGNQSNMVCIKPYPKTKLLGFRRLTDLSNIIPKNIV